MAQNQQEVPEKAQEQQPNAFESSRPDSGEQHQKESSELSPENGNNHTQQSNHSATESILAVHDTPASAGSSVPLSVRVPDLGALNLTTEQLEQLTTAQAQAIAQAAAAAMAATCGDGQQQLYPVMDTRGSRSASPSDPVAKEQEYSNATATEGSTFTSSSVSQLTADMLRRELMNQKVRSDNRERKKRWRALNEERNKDNDLRCRVNKRAHKLFGPEDSVAKRKWVEDEFEKRKQKRRDKERRGMAGVSGIPQQTQALSQFNHNAVLPDMNHLALLCQHLGMLSSTKPETKGEDQPSLSNPLLDFLQQLQQQQHQQEANAVVNSITGSTAQTSSSGEGSVSEPTRGATASLTNTEERPEDKLAALLSSTIGSSAAAAAAAAVAAVAAQSSQGNSEQTGDTSARANTGNGVDFPMEAVLTLMQLNAGWRQ